MYMYVYIYINIYIYIHTYMLSAVTFRQKLNWYANKLEQRGNNAAHEFTVGGVKYIEGEIP